MFSSSNYINNRWQICLDRFSVQRKTISLVFVSQHILKTCHTFDIFKPYLKLGKLQTTLCKFNFKIRRIDQQFAKSSFFANHMISQGNLLGDFLLDLKEKEVSSMGKDRYNKIHLLSFLEDKNNAIEYGVCLSLLLVSSWWVFVSTQWWGHTGFVLDWNLNNCTV